MRRLLLFGLAVLVTALVAGAAVRASPIVREATCEDAYLKSDRDLQTLESAIGAGLRPLELAEVLRQQRSNVRSTFLPGPDGQGDEARAAVAEFKATLSTLSDELVALEENHAGRVSIDRLRSVRERLRVCAGVSEPVPVGEATPR